MEQLGLVHSCVVAAKTVSMAGIILMAPHQKSLCPPVLLMTSARSQDGVISLQLIRSSSILSSGEEGDYLVPRRGAGYLILREPRLRLAFDTWDMIDCGH